MENTNKTGDIKQFKGRSLGQETWRRLLKNRGAVVGMIFMILLVIVAILAEFIYGTSE